MSREHRQLLWESGTWAQHEEGPGGDGLWVMKRHRSRDAAFKSARSFARWLSVHGPRAGGLLSWAGGFRAPNGDVTWIDKDGDVLCIQSVDPARRRYFRGSEESSRSNPSSRRSSSRSSRSSRPRGAVRYSVSNIADGDMRWFRTDRYGEPSAASVRHALRQGGMGFRVTGPGGGRIHDRIDRIIDDIKAARW